MGRPKNPDPGHEVSGHDFSRAADNQWNEKGFGPSGITGGISIMAPYFPEDGRLAGNVESGFVVSHSSTI